MYPLKITFPENFNEKYKQFSDMLLDILAEKEPQNQIEPKAVISQKSEAKIENSAGKLSAYSDGTIRYGNEILTMRNQLKDLCRLFMEHPNDLVLIDTIKEELIKAEKRGTTPWSTISKYVSELHTSLKVHFKKDVIFNQKEEGWYFKP